MIYIYDILLNFCDNNLIYEFYEWDKNDNIENIKRIKLVHVSKEIYNKLLKYDVVIDDEFLLKIFKTCEVYDKKKVKILDYCVLFSDGESVIAVEFSKNGNSMYKSKLLLDEEEEIALLASNIELTSIKLKTNRKVLKNRFYTRKECLIKTIFQKEVEDAYRNKKYGKLSYLYQEYFEKSISSYKKMKDDLLLSINTSVNEKHHEIYDLLILTKKKKQV